MGPLRRASRICQTKSSTPEDTRNAGGGIRTHEPLGDEVLSLAPLTRLGDPRVCIAGNWFNYNGFPNLGEHLLVGGCSFLIFDNQS